MLEAKAATKGAVVGAQMGEGAWATVMPSDAFSASETTADARNRRTIVWGGRADRGDIRGAVFVLSLLGGPSYL